MKYILLILLFISTSLAQGFNILDLKTSSHESSLIYKTVPSSKKAVLYIHGFNDYFFNEELAQKFLEKGYSFFAIELHNYGKKLNVNSNPYFFKDIHEFDEELTLAISHIKNDFGITDITLYGYSQGALVATLYANGHKNINRLIVDSAFFDFEVPLFIKKFILPFVAFVGNHFPSIKINLTSPNTFGQSLHKDFYGEWDFDISLKQIQTNAPIYLGWIHAIYQAQQTLHKKLNLNIPVLSLYSNISSKNLYFTSDIVLDVKTIEYYSNFLNDNPNLTTHKVIQNSIHGVTLSQEPARTKAYIAIFEWLKKTN
ncbi:MAG: alpha/beta fold hydrolase [Arcobacteraceae bacterium]